MKFTKKQWEALRIVSLSKIKFAGKSKIGEYYDVGNMAYNTVTIIADKNNYVCTCKDCSVKTGPNGNEPRCVFVLAVKLAQWLKATK